ncbi:MAG: hypothetical protein A2Y57_01120 [Candidatus Woykebacteria bacterium RBG_13_40_7b]|uniref:Uncharacterized protein n=1 Tax=Candidatus Woykebacteria bacterium RBG_13_40_7b TaxID=1802594 RepID=A0A1G1WB97_9BACT|nr:MAG: hypothetical protein A2Y57_01120 [Candidatus Woykebacteria bacterium RBG_13_40_7b]
MGSKIELNEKQNEDFFSMVDIPNSYSFTIVDGVPNPTTFEFYSQFLADHYILFSSSNISGREGVSMGIKGRSIGVMFDIAHEVIEAEATLYRRAKAGAESYAKALKIEKIVDNTKFALERQDS